MLLRRVKTRLARGQDPMPSEAGERLEGGKKGDESKFSGQDRQEHGRTVSFRCIDFSARGLLIKCNYCAENV